MAVTLVNINGKYQMLVKQPGLPLTTTNYTHNSLSYRQDKPTRIRSRKPVGWLYPKPYLLDVEIHRRSVGIVKTLCYEGSDPLAASSYTFTGDLAGFIDRGDPCTLPEKSSNEERQSVIEALTKLKDQRVNLGVAFAEAQRTADFVGKVSTQLARAAQHAVNKDFKRALGTLGVSNYRNYPKGWLGYQYAAKPLLGDVYGSIEQLKDRTKFDDWVVTVKGVTKHTEREQRVVQSQENHPGTRVIVDEQRFRGYFTRLDYHPTNDLLAYASSLGVTNPAEVLWELVPFSFVADWFVPIGEWFSTFDAALGFTFLSGSTTERRETIQQWRSEPGPAMSTYPFSKDVGSRHEGKARTFRLERTVIYSSPIVALPRVKNPLSLGHMANGLSLLAAVFGKR